MDSDVYLEMTYRNGKPLAGYLDLAEKAGLRVARSREAAPGLVVDYAADGRPVGIEIVSPSVVSVLTINRVLAELDREALTEEQLTPLPAS